MINIKDFIFEKLKLNKDIEIGADKKEDDPTTWDVGDILSGTFGYNMVIPAFFKVIKKTAKQFTVVKLSKKLASGHYNGSFEEVPDESKLDQDLKRNPIRARINKRNHLVIDNIYVSLWDGKPVHGDDMD